MEGKDKMVKISIKTTYYIHSSFVACLLWLFCHAPAAAQTVAMVTDIIGKAAVVGATANRNISILSEISAGTRLQLDAGARLMVLYTASGDEYAVNGPALLEFKVSDPVAVIGAKPEKKNRAAGKIADLRIKTASTVQAGYVMRNVGTAPRLKLLSPTNGKILTIAPEFQWMGLRPGVKYQFELADETGKTLHEASIETAHIRLPTSVVLQEGIGYTWQVSVRMSDGRRYSSTADFSVAAAELRARAESLRPEASAPVAERVVYAVWLEQEHLKEAARTYWKALAAERPDDAQLKALAHE
jgi:hypothetical protein